MKKTYIKPAIETTQVEVTHMLLAESLGINNEITKDGKDALGKDNDWDIWGKIE